MKQFGGYIVELFNSSVLVKYQNELEEARNAIEKRDFWLAKWNQEEQSKLLPAGKWNERDRIVPIFSLFSYIVVFLSIMLVIPAFIIIPMVIKKYIVRAKLRKLILQQQRIINGTLPIPLGSEEYVLVKETYWGRRFINNNIIFNINSPLL